MNRVKVIQTARDTNDRLTSKGEFSLAGGTQEGVTFNLDTGKKYQKIIGFGGAFTESAAYTFSRMGPSQRDEILRKYFDPEDGIGYSIGRVHINSCDFSLENYTYVEEGDKELKTFDISREDKWTVPLIKAAIETRKGDIGLLASPWSSPAWMKTNRDMNHGGQLLPEYREAWSVYFTKYIKAMRARGLNIWAITVQNEPAAVQTWDSCIYSAEGEGSFVRDYLGPVMQREGLSDIKIYIWDHNRDIMVERAKETLSDPEAAKYVYGIANHWYVSEEFENLSKVHELFPDKHILFSEGCQEGGVHPGSWLTGERYGRNMIGDFNNWQEGWLDWNIILDETGGPNHVGNLCDAPVIADTKTQKIHYNSSYYYIGQFSKFVKPGAARIEVTADSGTSLQYVGFQNEDGSVVLIVMNETDKAESFNAGADGAYLSYSLPAHSITTLLFNNK
ncbi:MAG TPA: glycoside hydrolase family 30 protein [Ruminiclostridium sp.]|nr:glycoside hydrolase family 30 protein [Ruminiclostridium sp.]